MSQQKEEMSDKKQGAVKLDDLPRRQEGLTGEEARQVKGGGGVSGGVLPTQQRAPIGEEIPQ